MRRSHASRMRTPRPRGRASVSMPVLTICLSVFTWSEVVPPVGEVERFVDEREVGNDVAHDGVFQHRPVLPRRIVPMAAADAARRARRRAPPGPGRASPRPSPMPIAPAGGADSTRLRPSAAREDRAHQPQDSNTSSKRSDPRGDIAARPAHFPRHRARRRAGTAGRRADPRPGRWRGREPAEAQPAARVPAHRPVVIEAVLQSGMLVVDIPQDARLAAAASHACRSASTAPVATSPLHAAGHDGVHQVAVAERLLRCRSQSSFRRENWDRPKANAASLPSAPRSPR